MLGACCASPASLLFNATSVASSFHRSSITRIKDQNLFLRDINQERAQMEASRDQISPKSKLSRPPSFSDSPKEDDKENEKEKRDGFSKDESGTESDTEDSSEEDSEEDSEEEEPPKPSVNSVAPSRANVTVNSLPSKPAVNSLKKPADESESEEETGSETEESSEEEEEDEPVKPGTRTSTTSSSRTPVSRAQSTPLSASKPGVGGTSKLLKSPFLDNDKKANAPSSPVSKTEPSRTSRLAGKEDTKDETKSRFGSSYPTRTTAATTSTTTSTTTTNTRGRISSTPSEDSLSRSTRAKRVTKRAATSYVGSGAGGRGDEEEEEEEEEDRKSNDISHRKASRDDDRKVTLLLSLDSQLAA